MTPEQARSLLKSPPVGPDGYASYVAARFRADAEDIAKLRARFRGMPVAFVAASDHVDLVMVMAQRQPAEAAIAMAWTIRAAIDLPPGPCAPDLHGAPPWTAPRMTGRDAIRVAIAVAGSFDFIAIFGRTVDAPRHGLVANSAGTMTYVGREAA